MGFEEEHPETHIAIGIVDEDGEETYIENGVNLVSHLKVKKRWTVSGIFRKSRGEKSDSRGILLGRNGEIVEGECDYEEIVSDNFGLCNMYM